VNHCSNWDIAKRQVIAWLDICRWTVLDLGALFDADRSDDVTLLSISKVKKCDTSRTVWIVFNVRNGGWNSILVVA